MTRKRSLRRTLALLVLHVPALHVPAQHIPAGADEALPLESGHRLETSVATGRTVRYHFLLDRGDLLNLEVEQVGIDVRVGLSGPGGEVLADVDGLLGASGVERIVWLAEKEGRFEVGIHGIETCSEAGKVVIRLDRPKPASAADRLRASAARTYYQAKELFDAGKAQSAMRKYREAADRWARLAEAAWVTEVHIALGSLHFQDEQGEDSLRYFALALETAEDAAAQATAHFMSGETLLDLGQLNAARERYERAFSLWQETEDRHRMAVAASNVGLTYKRLGELQNALTYYRAALATWRDRGMRLQETITLNNIGKAYISLGRTEEALRSFREALEIAEDMEFEEGQGFALNGLGQSFEKAGDLEKALVYLERSLKYRERGSEGRAATLAGIGQVLYRQGDTDRALKLYQRSLGIFRDHDNVRGEASVLRKIGLLLDASDPDQAYEHYRRALELFQQAGYEEGKASCQLGLARAQRARGELRAARTSAEQAIEIVERLRDHSADIELRSSYFATKESYYDFYVDLLMELHASLPGSGYAAAALSASERSRSRSLLDALSEGGIRIRRGVEPDLLEREQHLTRRHRDAYYRLEQSLASRPAGAAEAHAAQQQIQLVEGELADLRNEIRARSPVYAALKYPQPLRADEIRQVLDEDSLLLEYQLGDRRSFVWVVTSDALEAFELPDGAMVEDLAKRTRDFLNVSYHGRYRRQSEWTLEEAGELLLGPVADHLNKKRILVVAEGELQLVPFAALSATPGGEPLVARHEVVSIPSISLIPVLRERSRERLGAPYGVAVLADPVFRREDPRIADPVPLTAERDPVQGLPARLSYTLQEAENILRLAGDTKNLKAVSFDASKEMATSKQLRDYEYIHIATHGHLDTDFPELSSLVFSLFGADGEPREGRLRTHEIYNLDIRARLVALSACQTGRSDGFRGDGLVGWTQGFLYSGAQRVLVSLWNIDDEATSTLMERFYIGLLKEDLSPAAALRRAQNYVRRRPQWQTPYYWAGFVLQGEFL